MLCHKHHSNLSNYLWYQVLKNTIKLHHVLEMKIQERIVHLGEFYQLDFEMSFAVQEDVFKVIETVIPNVFKANTDWKVEEGEFLRIPYNEAMEKYGTDKPDLRNPLIITDLTDVFKDTEFNSFKDKTVKAIAVGNMQDTSRKFLIKCLNMQ